MAVLIPNHTEEELTTFCFSTKRGLSPEAKIPSKKKALVKGQGFSLEKLYQAIKVFETLKSFGLILLSRAFQGYLF